MSRARQLAQIGAAALLMFTMTSRAPSAQQLPPRDVRPPAPPPTGTAAIGGVVVTADGSARPLRMAHVVLIGTATGTLRVTSSDADGRFAFTNLPADRFIIGASKPPYLGAVAGARRAARPGTPIAVGDGEKVADVAVRLPLGAVITGVITDERGQPAGGVLLGLQRTQGSERVLVTPPGGLVGTDEHGRYRIFGLAPGEYFVVALQLGGGQLGAVALSDADMDAALKGTHVPSPPLDPASRYAPVFFPGTTRASDAAPIQLSVGEERQGVDFRLELTRVARADGTVTTSDGQPAAGAELIVAAAASNPLQFTSRVRVGPDGRFGFGNLWPGSYTLIAQASGAQAGQSAALPIEVEGVDHTGLQLTLRPPLTFLGRLVFDGATPPAVAGRRVPLTTLTPGVAGGATPQVGPANANGIFEVSRVSPGRYVLGGPIFFGATADSVTWSLQSVVVDGHDVTDLPIDITSDAAPKDVVVTYGDRWQQVTGRLLQSSGAPASEYTIVVFPSNRAFWLKGSRRILTTHPGTDGRFTVSGPGPLTLPPGDYLIAAVDDIDRGEEFDHAFLSSIVAAAIPLTLHSGEKKVQDLIIK